jgi:hypothetical protein
MADEKTYGQEKDYIKENMDKFVALGLVDYLGKDKNGKPVYGATVRFFALSELISSKSEVKI